MKDNTTTMTQIAMSVAVLIAGGSVIFFLSTFVTLPGSKYVLMAPFLGMVMTICIETIHTSWLVLKINTVFGGIMSFVNLYMGLAIWITGLLTEAIVRVIPIKKAEAMITAIVYSAITVLTTLVICKFMIGGVVYKTITPTWMLTGTLLGGALGAFGGYYGTIIGRRIVRIRKHPTL